MGVPTVFIRFNHYSKYVGLQLRSWQSPASQTAANAHFGRRWFRSAKFVQRLLPKPRLNTLRPGKAGGRLGRLASVVEVVVPHEDGRIFPADTGLQHLAHEQGVVALGHLAHDFALLPGRRIEQQRAARLTSQFKAFAFHGIAVPLLGLEKVECHVYLVAGDDIDRKDPLSFT